MTAPFAVLARDGQQPVHRGDRAQVDAVIEESGPHLGRCQIAVFGRPQHRQHVLTFGLGERVGRRRAWDGRAKFRGLVPPIVGGTGPTQQGGSPADACLFREFVEVVVDHLVDLGSVSALSEMSSKSACAFPVISNANLVRSS